MKIMNTAKNGQPVQIHKSLEELTEAELNKLSSQELNDSKTFNIQMNKKGELLFVTGVELNDEAEARLTEPKGYDILDAMTLLNGKKGTKEMARAKRKYNNSHADTITTTQINAAKRALEG